MKKLPKIYKEENQSFNKTNTEYCTFKNESETVIDNTNIKEKINSIFKGLIHSTNVKVIIKTKERLYETYLVSRTRDNVITIDKELIPINEILYIKEKID